MTELLSGPDSSGIYLDFHLNLLGIYLEYSKLSQISEILPGTWSPRTFLVVQLDCSRTNQTVLVVQSDNSESSWNR